MEAIITLSSRIPSSKTFRFCKISQNSLQYVALDRTIDSSQNAPRTSQHTSLLCFHPYATKTKTTPHTQSLFRKHENENTRKPPLMLAILSTSLRPTYTPRGSHATSSVRIVVSRSEYRQTRHAIRREPSSSLVRRSIASYSHRYYPRMNKQQ